MKTEMQEITDADIQEVEYSFFATIGGRDLLFIKPTDEKAICFSLKANYLKELVAKYLNQKGK